MKILGKYHGWRDWKSGLIIVALCVVAGLLVGFAITKAQATPTSPSATSAARYPECDNCSTARVKNKRQGMRKFKDGKLGRTTKGQRYPKKFKRIVITKLQRKLNSDNKAARAVAGAGEDDYWTRYETWAEFKSTDTCLAAAKPQVGSPSTRGRFFTCEAVEYMKEALDKPSDIKPSHIRAVICGGLTGIGIKGVLATGTGGPWVWAGIGAGAAACMWQDYLEGLAD